MQEIDQTLQEFNSQKKLSQVCNDFFNFLKGDFIDTTDTINYQKQNYNYTIVRQITTIEEDENSNLQTYIIASFDLGKVEKIPNKTFLANLSRSVYEKYIFVPFVIVFRYRVNEQNYLTFSISQIRDKTNQRTGKTKTTKVILLKDINLEKPHPAHSKILEKLKNETTAVKNFDELHENWLKVLNIKELGDEFYKKILEKYNDLVEKIILPTHTNPSENDKKDFALKLFGRLIFCWFLKAKGWVSEDILGSKIVEAEFIRQNEISFYHQILEPLFFESLNKDPQTRDFENKEKFASVPYLNGGLFEATEKDFYDSNLKDTDKRTNWKLEIPNQNLKEIFELFESYYFTIDENTSTEQEIGVDPEMMGRIFENFILNRSSTGSFYTPREIVDYMVETSLLEFMETKINYVDLTIDYFLELTKKDDHTLTGILENYPKRRFITKIKDNNFEISFYLLAKLRGWHLINDKITRISHRHIEIDYGFWSSFFGQNFEIETYFFAKSKDVFIHKIQVKIPKIGIIISINELKYVLILSFSSAGFWIIDTCYQLFGNKSEKLKKEAKKNLEELKHFWTNKNIPQGDIGFFEVDGYYHRAHSERQLSEIFTVFQRIYSKIINKEKNLVKFFSANKIQKFLDGVFCNTKKSLEKDKKQQIIQTLNSLKILDPACGSGAFPMGVLQKLTEIRKSLGEVYSQEDKERIEKEAKRIDPKSQIEIVVGSPKSLYQIKKEILQNSIYGVDLLPIAVEISRLRCWLSLVVDEDKNDPKPLPNLEFKFVCANSLVGNRLLNNIYENQNNKSLNKDDVFVGSGSVFNEILQKLAKVKQDTFESRNKDEQKKLYQELKQQLQDESLTEQDLEDIKNKIKKSPEIIDAYNIIKFDHFTNTPADFFDSEWMFGESGFDLVIGNPPYVQLQKDGGILGKQFEKLGYQTFAKTGDLYQLFYEKSVDLLSKNGISCFITSNKWMRAGYGEKLRKFFLTQTKPLILFDLGGDVFESATVDSNILICQKK